MFPEIAKKMLDDLRIEMKDIIVDWAGEQGFFPNDLQVAELVAALSDAQVIATQKLTNNAINMIADKSFIIEKINKHWGFVETELRRAQGFFVRPVPKEDPKKLLILFSKDKHEKGDDNADKMPGS